MKELPIACELTPAEIAARREGLLPGLLALAQERVTMGNGLRWRFAPSAEFLTAAAKTIDAERRLNQIPAICGWRSQALLVQQSSLTRLCPNYEDL
jgi:hypothetical protein